MSNQPPNDFKCPKCGSDYIRGIDPTDFYDGSGGECGSCGLDVAMVVFEDGSWIVSDASGGAA